MEIEDVILETATKQIQEETRLSITQIISKIFTTILEPLLNGIDKIKSL